MNIERPLRLLWFNLGTDADAPIQGFTTTWINALSPFCERIDVVTMRAGRLALADNVRVYSVGKEKGYGEPRRALEFYRTLFGLLRRARYDACFAHQIPLFAVMGAPLLKAWRVPVTLWYAHGATPFMLKLAEKLVDHIATSSLDGCRLSSRKVQIVGQGIDTHTFAPVTTPRPPDSPFTIVSVGRIAPVKKLEAILEAARRLVNRYGLTHFRVRLVGNTYPQFETYAASLRALVQQYRLEDVVEFPGAVTYDAVAQEYQNADVMVNMSATGSLDKAVLEAMACGVPVITANDAYRPVLARWEDQLLVPPEAPDVLAGRLRAIAAMSPGERAALGAELRALVVEQHSLDRLAQRLVTILSQAKG